MVGLTIQRHSSIDEAKPLWERVFAADFHATFFSSPCWLQTWWEHHSTGRDLLLLSLSYGTEPVGFAPLMLDPIPGGLAVRFLGSGLSDYGDILVDEGTTDRQLVVRSVLDHVTGLFPGALFDFQQVRADSPTLPIIQEWMKELHLKSAVMLQDVCPVITLPDSVEQYHKALKKSFLADIRRGDRRLRERGTVTLTDHLTPGDGDWTSLRDQMADLQSQRMRTKGEVPLWQGPLGAFVKDVLAAADTAGKLRVTTVHLDETMIAYELCFLHRQTIYAWSRAFAEAHKNTGPGKIALLHLLETGIGQGYRVFDLLRGEEPYKDLWTNGQVNNHRVLFLKRPSPSAWVLFQYETSWKTTLRKSPWLRRLNRIRKSLTGGR